jgi:hypothetical protein
MPRPGKSRTKSKMLAVIGVALGFTSYFCKEGIDAIERTKSSLENQLASYHSSLTTQTTQFQLLDSKQQLEGLMQRDSSKDKTQADFRAMIVNDTGSVYQAQAMVQEDIEGVRSLIEALPFGSEKLRDQLNEISAKISENDRKSRDTLKASSDNSWQRAVQIKLALVMTIINELPVSILGDTVITRAKHQAEISGSLISFGRWMVRILFVAAAFLTVYGIFKGVKVSEAAAE